MGKEVTIYDVAKHAGVSISTVSNVLNRPERVGAQTRARVLASVDELGFVPNLQAVSQARKSMRRIGVVAPFSSYASFYRRLSGILAEATANFVEVSVFDIESAATSPSPLLASIPIQGQLSGLIVMGEQIEESTERRVFERGVPTVCVDAESAWFSTVRVDDVAGGRLAAEYLLGRGRRRLAFLAEEQSTAYESQAVRRLAGFRHRVKQSRASTLAVRGSAPSTEAARVVAREMLGAEDRPDAVMAYFDDMAVGVLLAAGDLGLRVPEDVMVMGYDDGPTAVAASLTTVRQPFEESGSVAARLLLGAIETPTPRTLTFLEPRIVERESTAAAKVSA